MGGAGVSEESYDEFFTAIEAKKSVKAKIKAIKDKITKLDKKYFVLTYDLPDSEADAEESLYMELAQPETVYGESFFTAGVNEIIEGLNDFNEKGDEN